MQQVAALWYVRITGRTKHGFILGRSDMNPPRLTPPPVRPQTVVLRGIGRGEESAAGAASHGAPEQGPGEKAPKEGGGLRRQ